MAKEFTYAINKITERKIYVAAHEEDVLSKMKSHFTSHMRKEKS